MTVLDTSIIIDRVKKREHIIEIITEVSILEYPSILLYKMFPGQIYLIDRIDIEKALELKISLRAIGKPKGIADLLIATICINHGEKLITRDQDFRDIALVSNLDVEIIE